MATDWARIWFGVRCVVFTLLVWIFASTVFAVPGMPVSWIWRSELLMVELYALPLVLLAASIPWSYYAGAINRSAAVEFATGRRPSRSEVSQFAASRCGAYVWPAVALVMILVAVLGAGALAVVAASHVLSAAAVAVGSFISLYVVVVVRQKAVSVVAGQVVGVIGATATILCAWLLWGVHSSWLGWTGAVLAVPVILVLAVVAALLALLFILGRGMMTSTVSFEGSGAVDAATRATAYIMSRPWRSALHWLCSAVCVTLFGALLAGLVWWGSEYLFTPGLAALERQMWLPESMLSLFPGCVLVVLACLVAGWCISFVQCARAISYALLRQSVDQSDPSEVFLESGVEPAASPEQSQPQ